MILFNKLIYKTIERYIIRIIICILLFIFIFPSCSAKKEYKAKIEFGSKKASIHCSKLCGFD